ncbi:MAG: hypothetical protein ACLGI3_17205, partial [Actinomycetes bacterium]
ADFRLNRRIVFNNPAVEGSHPYFVLSKLGSVAFEGAGQHPASATLAKQGRWWASDSRQAVVGPASFPALAGYKGDANVLSLHVGCQQAGSPCRVGAGGGVFTRLFGAAITVSDPKAPDVTVAASGLLAGGQRDGSDLVTLDGADSSGIRRVELVDVTGAAVVVGAEEYDPDRAGSNLNDRRAGCSWRLRKPCPDLNEETVRPSSLEAGRRQLLVRVFDAAGNPTDRGPYPVDVVTPSDRGALNGAEDARVLLTGDTRRTVGHNAKVTIRGVLRTPTGAAVAGAELRVLTRDLHRDVFVDRGTVTTGADGSFSYRATAYASRLVQIGWRARMRDTRFAHSGYATVRARARSSLTAPRRVRVGRTFTISGRLLGLRPGKSVAVIAQGRSGRRRFQTFEDGRTRGRTFRIRYRFRNPSSRGRTFQIRVRLIPRGGWPYEEGVSRTVRVRVR